MDTEGDRIPNHVMEFFFLVFFYFYNLYAAITKANINKTNYIKEFKPINQREKDLVHAKQSSCSTLNFTRLSVALLNFLGTKLKETKRKKKY